MFVMHHGFRRDLRDLILAFPATPLTDAEVWAALDRRWRGLATALHHHHRVVWPPLLQSVRTVNDSAGQESLKAMQAEHALLGPLVQACTDGFLAMESAPHAAVRDRLMADLARTREVLLNHCELAADGTELGWDGGRDGGSGSKQAAPSSNGEITPLLGRKDNSFDDRPC